MSRVRIPLQVFLDFCFLKLIINVLGNFIKSQTTANARSGRDGRGEMSAGALSRPAASLVYILRWGCEWVCTRGWGCTSLAYIIRWSVHGQCYHQMGESMVTVYDQMGESMVNVYDQMGVCMVCVHD